MLRVREIPKVYYNMGKLLLVFIIPLLSFSQSDIQKIKDVLFMQEKYWNEGNIDGFMLGYWPSEKLEFSSKSGTTYGWDNIKSKYKKSYPSRYEMGKLSFVIITVQLNSDTTAIVHGEWELFEMDDHPQGTFFLTLQKFNEHWLIIKDYTTSE